MIDFRVVKVKLDGLTVVLDGKLVLAYVGVSNPTVVVANYVVL